MGICYSLWDPSGNVTVLVETPVAAEERPAVAARLMVLEPTAEQVGFLGADAGEPGTESACSAPDAGTAGSDPGADVALSMAGGEFCGNATMSAAVWALEHAAPAGAALAAHAAGPGFADGGKAAVRVETSGAAEPVTVECAPAEGGAWRCSLQMPAPTAVTAVDLPLSGSAGSLFRAAPSATNPNVDSLSSASPSATVRLPIVHFDGISHLIVERSGALTPEERADAERYVRDWCEHLNVEGLGLLFLDRNERHMTPLVYIPGAGTLCWENACGSGTCAVGAYLAAEQAEPLTLALQQPGGTLEVRTSRTGPLTLTGTVRLLRQDTAALATDSLDR